MAGTAAASKCQSEETSGASFRFCQSSGLALSLLFAVQKCCHGHVTSVLLLALRRRFGPVEQVSANASLRSAQVRAYDDRA